MSRLKLVLLSLFLLGVCSFSPAQARVSPKVLAFYYAWFDANTWQPSVVPDMPAQPYASTDPAAIARQIQQAKGAGIDAFVVSWIGANFPTNDNFKKILDASKSAGFSATVDFEAQRFGSREAVQNALAYVRDTFMSHPAFLRENGRPVVFFWREQVLPVGVWAEIRQALDPDHRQIWIAEGVDISYQQVFDGHHLYSIAWAGDPGGILADWGGRVRRAAADKLWVATVMPGYDDTRTTRADKFVRARNNGDLYRTMWQGALNSGPDWVIITSFNEWVEGSMIEPSTSYGNLYLDVTREWANKFKLGNYVSSPTAPVAPRPAAPAAAPASPPVAAAGPSPAPVARGDTARVAGISAKTTDALRIRTGPGKEYGALGRLAEGDSVSVVARSDDGFWLQLALDASVYLRDRGWVMAEYMTSETSWDALPTSGASPAPTQPASPTPTLDSAAPDTAPWWPDWY